MSTVLTTRTRRILIADDSPAIHDDFRKILVPPINETGELDTMERAVLGTLPAKGREAIFSIDSAFQGEEAITLVENALAEQDPYTMAYVDVRMPPGCDGIETIQKMRAIDPRIQIVICTAYSDYSWEEIFEKLGRHEGVVILRKPFDPIEALQLAHAMTEKWSLHRKSEREMEDLEIRVAERTADLRRAEAQYRGAITGAGAIPYAFDYGSQSYIFMGERIEDLIGYSRDEVTVDLWNTIVQESTMLGEALGLSRSEAIEGVKRGEIRNWRCDMRVLTRSGESRWISDASILDFDWRGKITQCTGILQDITERRTLEQKLLRSQRMESIGTLAGGIAHDLNNILAPIMMAVGLLQESKMEKHCGDLLSTIELSARRGASMVAQVLSFARGVEGEHVLLQVNYLLRDIEKMANDTFLKSIQITVNIPSTLWTVSGDSTQIHQVLLNLCVNARDAMPDGGSLTLSAENVVLESRSLDSNPEARPGPYIAIHVQDTGVGITPENMDKLFEPFFTTKARDGGTGLGLPTSLSIVRSHGGFIQVRSEPGEGTEFVVYLPAQRDETASVAEPSGKASMPRGRGEMILVVDDEEHVRRMLQYVLESFGYRASLAASGKEALMIFRESRNEIGAIITDMMMPGMSGRELIDAMRTIDPEARVLAASGVHGTEKTLSDSELRPTQFLRKPYSVEALLNALREALSSDENAYQR